MSKIKVIAFGAGRVFRFFLQVYNSDKIDIISVCDNDAKKQGRLIQGILIISPSLIKEMDFHWIIITSMQNETIKKQLIEKEGINEIKILDFSYIYEPQHLLGYDIWNEYLKHEFFWALYRQENKNFQREIIELERKNVFLSAKGISESYYNRKIRSLEEVEFQVFSQFGEDGIIQWIIKNIDVKNKVFVEFGVENYLESNTRYLLMNDNWSGLVIDASEEYIRQILNWDMRWRYDLTAIPAFITKDNINEIITNAGVSGDIGILSIDIDGNDYWILNAIKCVNPQILICEYNNLFGNEKKVTIPYQENFYRTDSHYSNLYYGASLKAFCDFAEKNGYYYLGSNSAGHNAFFVKKTSMDYSKIPIDNKVFVECKYRESRDKDGKLNYLNKSQKLNEIKNMKLIDLEDNILKKISDIYNLT